LLSVRSFGSSEKITRVSLQALEIHLNPAFSPRATSSTSYHPRRTSASQVFLPRHRGGAHFGIDIHAPFAGGSLATAQHRGEFTAFGLVQFDPIPYIHLGLLLGRLRTNRRMSQKSGAGRHNPAFTDKLGLYLAFIYTYSPMFRRAPAEADMQRHFRVSPPSVHQMVLTLERAGFIRRQPGVARSIELLVASQALPILQWLNINPSKSL
jgi:hypothetical protein